MTQRTLPATALLLGAIVSLGGCNEKGLGYGDPNSVIAVMPAEQWEDVEADVYEVLEQTIMTVAEEKTFTVTFQEPGAEFWDRLRRFRQMVVVGSRSDYYVQEVIEEARNPITENGIHQVYNVWATGQNVTLVLLDDGWGRDDLVEMLPGVQALLDGQYRAYARNRMYFSGIDSALADTLSIQAGFSMYYPDVYDWMSTDSVYLFRNDNPDPSELIRQITVTWLTPAPEPLGADEVIAWRNRIAEEHYSEPQMLILDGLTESSFEFEGNQAFQLQAQWQNIPERSWPAGGPLITRTVTCDTQDRMYLLDAWLYAPGREKYEYMIQLETLLDTFRCTS
jgi:hypothetical protein